MTDSHIAAKNIQLGDIFYIQVCQRYYFLQVIQVVEHAPAPFGSSDCLGFNYYIVVLNKTFLTLPSAIDELDLIHIYQPKFIWKKTLFYFSLWNKEPCISFDETLMNFEYKEQYTLTKFANTRVAEIFKPAITLQNTSPTLTFDEFKALDSAKEGAVKPASSAEPMSIQVVIWAIEQEEKGKLKKKVSVNPLYFKEWLDFVEPDCIIKIEKIITQFDTPNIEEDVQKALKKAVLAINKLDDKLSFISTLEAEDIADVLIGVAQKRGLTVHQAVSAIDLYRSW